MSMEAVIRLIAQDGITPVLNSVKAAGDAVTGTFGSMGKAISDATAPLDDFAKKMGAVSPMAQSIVRDISNMGTEFGMLASGGIASFVAGADLAYRGASTVAGAIKGMADGFSSYSLSMESAAARTGNSVSSYSAFSKAMEASGADAQGLERALVMMNERMKESAQLGGVATGVFAKLGVSPTDEMGKMKTPIDQMKDLAAAIYAIEDPSQRAQAALEAFGPRGSAILAQLKNVGTDAFAEMVQREKDLGLATTDTDVQMSRDWDSIKAQFTQAGESIQLTAERTFMPTLLNIGKGAADMATSVVLSVKDMSQPGFLDSIKEALFGKDTLQDESKTKNPKDMTRAEFDAVFGDEYDQHDQVVTGEADPGKAAVAAGELPSAIASGKAAQQAGEMMAAIRDMHSAAGEAAEALGELDSAAQKLGLPIEKNTEAMQLWYEKADSMMKAALQADGFKLQIQMHAEVANATEMDALAQEKFAASLIQAQTKLRELKQNEGDAVQLGIIDSDTAVEKAQIQAQVEAATGRQRMQVDELNGTNARARMHYDQRMTSIQDEGLIDQYKLGSEYSAMSAARGGASADQIGLNRAADGIQLASLQGQKLRDEANARLAEAQRTGKDYKLDKDLQAQAGVVEANQKANQMFAEATLKYSEAADKLSRAGDKLDTISSGHGTSLIGGRGGDISNDDQFGHRDPLADLKDSGGTWTANGAAGGGYLANAIKMAGGDGGSALMAAAAGLGLSPSSFMGVMSPKGDGPVIGAPVASATANKMFGTVNGMSTPGIGGDMANAYGFENLEAAVSDAKFAAEEIQSRQALIQQNETKYKQMGYIAFDGRTGIGTETVTDANNSNLARVDRARSIAQEQADAKADAERSARQAAIDNSPEVRKITAGLLADSNALTGRERSHGMMQLNDFQQQQIDSQHKPMGVDIQGNFDAHYRQYQAMMVEGGRRAQEDMIGGKIKAVETRLKDEESGGGAFVDKAHREQAIANDTSLLGTLKGQLASVQPGAGKGEISLSGGSTSAIGTAVSSAIKGARLNLDPSAAQAIANAVASALGHLMGGGATGSTSSVQHIQAALEGGRLHVPDRASGGN